MKKSVKITFLFAFIAVYCLLTTSEVFAWLDGWQYRQEFYLINNGNFVNDLQVRVELSAANFRYDRARADGADIRFSRNENDTLYKYWCESWNAGSSSVFWVKISSVPTGSTRFCVYYGNTGASSIGSGKDTFEFFDDFSGTALDSSTWTAESSNGSYEVNNSQLRLYCTVKAANNYSRVVHSWTPAGDRIVETRIKPVGIYRGGTALTKSDGTTIMSSSNLSELAIHYNSGNKFHFDGNFAGSPSANNWYVSRYIIHQNSTADGYFYDDGAKNQLYSYTSRGTTALSNIARARLAVWQDTSSDNALSDYSFDWIRVRKYVSSEPSVIDSVPFNNTYKDNVSWLKAKADEMIMGGSKLANDGTRIYTPDGVGTYNAFWVRDWEYMLDRKSVV